MEASPEAEKVQGSVGVDNVAEMPTERLNRAGEGFPAGRRVLTYADLRAARPGGDPRPPSRDITLHLTRNMERFIWGFASHESAIPAVECRNAGTRVGGGAAQASTCSSRSRRTARGALRRSSSPSASRSRDEDCRQTLRRR